jgi:alkylhydroperoxidase family enzyme
VSQRFEPISAEEWGDEEYDAFGVLLGVPGEQVPRAGSGEKYDPLGFPVMGLLAHHPALAKSFLRFNNYQLFRGTLPDRLRELAILRTAQNRRSPFEWGEHVRIGQEAGITLDEIDALALGNDGFEGDDLVVLRATDDLLASHRMTDTWEPLLAALGKHGAIELIFVVGTYSTLAMAFETWGLPPLNEAVPLPPPIAHLPEGTRS